MKKLHSNQRSLRDGEAKVRAAYLFAIGLSFAGLDIFEPDQVSGWLPFHASCGAITGLPCLFCGMTRAMHHLLEGNLAAALYYNWLALPIIAGAVFLAAIFALDLVAGKKLLETRVRFYCTPRSVAIASMVLVSLWLLQVYLAISENKAELLNPSGPLYALFIR